jgi:hypothetical protein
MAVDPVCCVRKLAAALVVARRAAGRAAVQLSVAS